MLMYTGIDEAGYGPMLGPLCIAQSTLSVKEWDPSAKVPNLWAVLEQAIGKTKQDAKTKIAVGDSKNLKLANSTVTKHPLIHLERAVLAFLGARDGSMPTTDIQLFDTLGVKLDKVPWYAGDPIKLPLGNSPEILGIDCSHLQSVCARQGVELVDIQVKVIDVTDFNTIIRQQRSKAAATQKGLNAHLQWVLTNQSRFDNTRIVCDRQGGRTQYHSMLSKVFDDLETQEESPRASRYTSGDHLGVLLTPKADDAYFPVALASMAAKLVRELAMMRFNRYWATRHAEIKPTAGYVQDARRWLNDMERYITDDERKAMVRLA
tara:strand:+ start:413508 stop:414467 length:960 start_codon:yes stop_codon:yes gene_type:complete